MIRFVVAVMPDRAEVIDVLAGFREQLYECLNKRADALFELAEALLCTDGPVRTLVGLSAIDADSQGAAGRLVACRGRDASCADLGRVRLTAACRRDSAAGSDTA
ncbi:hypothetical protein KRM28CT15_07480 [Krasilnikovia sp. M28-CT-15]